MLKKIVINLIPVVVSILINQISKGVSKQV